MTLTMQTELTKRSKPEDLARFAGPGKGEGADLELLHRPRWPQLHTLVWHLEDRVSQVESLAQGIQPPTADLAAQHSKSFGGSWEPKPSHSEALLALVKDGGDPHEAPVPLLRHPLPRLANEVCCEALTGSSSQLLDPIFKDHLIASLLHVSPDASKLDLPG